MKVYRNAGQAAKINTEIYVTAQTFVTQNWTKF
jgi:hypothetical protein